ncbi:MAG: hypothetical protein IKF99_11875 [Oscillospiraceae bacterium]|nr:hypothetical protein [Oscillospiraceae bacterium]
MKIGTIVRNMYQPSIESLIVYRGVSGQYADVIWLLDGKVLFGHKFYKGDILNDREHFPIVGLVDVEKLVRDAVREAVKCNADIAD